MKVKKRVFLLLLIMILLGTTTVYGSIRLTTNTANTTNTVNETSNTSSNSKSSNNAVKEDDNSVKNNTTNSTSKSSNTTNSNTVESETLKKISNKKEEISDDIYSIDVENDLNYENYYINGNVYIICATDVSFTECEILGNVFIISDSFKMDDTVVNGSVYVASNTVDFVECDLYSVYAIGENILIDEDTVVTTDVRLGATNTTISGEIGRNAYIASDNVDVTDTASIAGTCDLTAQEYTAPKKIENSNNFSITVVEENESAITTSLQNILGGWAGRVVIILVIAIIILGGSPKFTAVNCTLKIRSFFKAFFTGLIEIIVIFAVLIVAMSFGFGIGYLTGVLLLMLALLILGKAIFIVSFGVRLVGNKNRNPRIKAFIFTVILAIIFEAINLFTAFGTVGIIAVLVINLILSITGFGTLIRIVLTARKKKKTPENTVKENTKTPEEFKPLKEEPKVPVVEPVKEIQEPEVEQEPKMIEIPIKKPKVEEEKPEIKEEPKQEEKENEVKKEESKEEPVSEVKEEKITDSDSQLKNDNVETKKVSEPKEEVEIIVEQDNKEEIKKNDDFKISDKNTKHKKLFGKDK